jgi:hypothetical protein
MAFHLQGGKRVKHKKQTKQPARQWDQPRQKTQSRRQQPQQTQRSFVVLSSLVAVLTLTSVLLRAMQGAPLTPDSASGIVTTGGTRSTLGVIFNTAVPAHPNRWKSVYIHHTRQAGGAAVAESGDHFVIGNGDGAEDGQIQFTARWNLQQPADPAPGCTSVEATCVSIGLVGDFDRTAPTPTQLKRLEQLVHTLQEHFRIASPQVWVFDQPNSPAGVGRYFPAAAFQGQLLR